MKYKVTGRIMKYESAEVEAKNNVEAKKMFLNLHPEYYDTVSIDLIDICDKCKYFFEMSHNHRSEESCRKGHYNDSLYGYRKIVNDCKDFESKKNEKL